MLARQCKYASTVIGRKVQDPDRTRSVLPNISRVINGMTDNDDWSLEDRKSSTSVVQLRGTEIIPQVWLLEEDKSIDEVSIEQPLPRNRLIRYPIPRLTKTDKDEINKAASSTSRKPNSRVMDHFHNEKTDEGIDGDDLASEEDESVDTGGRTGRQKKAAPRKTDPSRYSRVPVSSTKPSLLPMRQQQGFGAPIENKAIRLLRCRYLGSAWYKSENQIQHL